MTTYSEKLQDPRWQKKRLQVLKRDKWKCRCCGEDKVTLHVHHNKYIGNPWDVDLIHLKTVCKYCHSIIEDTKQDKNSSLFNLTRIELVGDQYFYFAFCTDLSDGDKFVKVYLTYNNEIEYQKTYWDGVINIMAKGFSKINKNL